MSSAASINDIYNFRQIAADLATSGQPNEEELAAVAKAGYEVVINLALHDDPRYSLPDETGTVRALGLEYVHIPVKFDAPTDQDLVAFFRVMEQYRGSKIWLHCAANKRVSAFLGLYLRLRQGKSKDEAFSLLKDIWEPDQVWSSFIARWLSER